LGARIRALLRRQLDDSNNNQLIVDDLIMDSQKQTVKRGEKIISLRRKEFDLLEYLLRNKGKVLKREMILDHVWDDNFESFTNVVDVHVKYLRDKIDKPYQRKLIKTIHGIGYKLDA
jgi:DNA-binding response OmpR family regulator